MLKVFVKVFVCKIKNPHSFEQEGLKMDSNVPFPCSYLLT